MNSWVALSNSELHSTFGVPHSAANLEMSDAPTLTFGLKGTETRRFRVSQGALQTVQVLWKILRYR